jgi:hypothetical protein
MPEDKVDWRASGHFLDLELLEAMRSYNPYLAADMSKADRWQQIAEEVSAANMDRGGGRVSEEACRARHRRCLSKGQSLLAASGSVSPPTGSAIPATLVSEEQICREHVAIACMASTPTMPALTVRQAPPTARRNSVTALRDEFRSLKMDVMGLKTDMEDLPTLKSDLREVKEMIGHLYRSHVNSSNPGSQS